MKEKRLIMENDNLFEPTIFDTLTQTRQIQMLKTAVPYMNPAQKRQFAILIKYMELQKAIQIFDFQNNSISACGLPEEECNNFNMLNDIRKYATSSEQEFIDTLTNLFSMLSLYSTIQ